MQTLSAIVEEKPKNSVKRSNSAGKNRTERLTDWERRFMDSFVKVTPLVMDTDEFRVPRYTVSRFDSDRDFAEARPVLERRGVLRPHAEFPLGENELVGLSRGQGFSSNYLKTLADVRSERDPHRRSKLKVPFCSPWQNGSAPLSSITNGERPLEGKVYCSVQVYFSGDDYVLSQENEGIFCYQPFWTHATALVAFPRVEENEVWTVGWVQGISKSFIDMRYKNEKGVRSV